MGNNGSTSSRRVRPRGLQSLERKAADVAAILGALANERRLMILCRLVEWGEANVTALAEEANLSQSALSQHLAKLRAAGIVATRRDAQTIYYRLASAAAGSIMKTLADIYCGGRRRKVSH